MDKIYLYNGIKLPSLPEWDAATYPYAAIVLATYPFKAILYVSKIPFTYREYIPGVMLVFGSIGYMSCGCSMNDEWSEFNVFDTEFRIAGLDWTNIDILDQDGSVYLAASDPIPVYTPSPVTLYHKTNNQLNPITLYRKESGSNKKLTLYRGE